MRSRILMGAAAIALVALPTAAFAGGKGSSGGNSLSLVVLGQTGGTTTTTSPTFGAQVTFDVTTGISRPYVLNECFKGGTRVYAEVHGFFSGALFGTTYTLGPTDQWTGGDAECTASLVDYSKGKGGKVLATIGYHVNG